LVWTTVPWTIPANLLLAVGRDIQYADVELEGQTYVVAVDAMRNYDKLKNLAPKRTYPGSELIGLTYQPVFDYFAGTSKAFRIVAADYVETETGTGIVSVAPG